MTIFQIPILQIVILKLTINIVCTYILGNTTKHVEANSKVTGNGEIVRRVGYA